MTINVTVEELRAYEVAVDKWYFARTAMIIEAAGRARFDQFDNLLNPRLINEAVKSWEAKNPRPRLIPEV